MSEHRPFPPSARRRALARRAGLHAASPILVGAIAAGAALLAAAALAAGARAQLGDAVTGAIGAAGAPDPVAAATAAPAAGSAMLVPAAAPRAVLGLALPLLAAAAIAAALAHIAQTRAAWLPRRRIDDAPALARGIGERTGRAAFELVSAAIAGACAVGWLWAVAPRLARLPTVPLAGAALLASAAAALAIAWAAIGVLDALLRHAALSRALHMTAQERREDERRASGDPRWRAYRARTARGPGGLGTRDAVAGASLLVLGDGAAVAIAWDAARRPIPTRTATGRAARATQLLALARRHRVPVHRDPRLAAALVSDDGPVPEAHWPRIAELLAAARRE